eukprot:TRINITY_DN2326_c0_g2_i1.p1 TRINITY_DN2326_c0_g2~~TRINITY_DN2326_c0_g2_i1.p1  ORF type:complete len:359 (+),score=111.64 TRINITY_DN2326_c0_g2_i1:88-1077(+)
MSLSFNCSICSQTLHQPCCLVECGHTFCFGCLVNKVTQRPGDEAVVICPSCHKSSPCSSAEALKAEFREVVSETLIELFGEQKSLVLSGSSLCGMEECDEKAEIWCPECKKNLCASCDEEHSKSRFLKSHKVTPLSQKKMDPVGKCSSCQAPTTGFCGKCEKLVCAICVLPIHKEHSMNSLVDQLEMRRKEMKDFIEDVKEYFGRSEKKRKQISQELERLKKELSKETQKNRVLKTAIEKLSLVNEQIKDEDVLETFVKLEKVLRNKLQLPELSERKLQRERERKAREEEQRRERQRKEREERERREKERKDGEERQRRETERLSLIHI